MPIDVSQVPWLFVALMAAFAFFAAILGSLISFRNKFVGAVIAGILYPAIAGTGAETTGRNPTAQREGIPPVGQHAEHAHQAH